MIYAIIAVSVVGIVAGIAYYRHRLQSPEEQYKRRLHVFAVYADGFQQQLLSQRFNAKMVQETLDQIDNLRTRLADLGVQYNLSREFAVVQSQLNRCYSETQDFQSQSLGSTDVTE